MENAPEHGEKVEHTPDVIAVMFKCVSKNITVIVRKKTRRQKKKQPRKNNAIENHPSV